MIGGGEEMLRILRKLFFNRMKRSAVPTYSDEAHLVVDVLIDLRQVFEFYLNGP